MTGNIGIEGDAAATRAVARTSGNDDCIRFFGEHPIGTDLHAQTNINV
jgi:hypothetical protein